MFTGIVEEIGTVVSLREVEDGARIVIAATTVLGGPTADGQPGGSGGTVRLGDSIAVSGVCLTVTEFSLDPGDSHDSSETVGPTSWFAADMMAETLRRTGLGRLCPGDRVNLERALAVGDRLGGHIVQGHVDGVGHLLRLVPGQQWHELRFSLPPALAPLVAEKGSIAVDGVSLTVTEVSPPGTGEPWFGVGLIPATLELTTLGAAQVGDEVNLEIDVLAKQLQRLAAFVGPGLSTQSPVTIGEVQ